MTVAPVSTPLRPADAASLRALRRVLVVAVIIAALAVTMNWISEHLVAPLFAYLGYTYVAAPFLVLATAIALTTAVALALPARITRPSHVVLWTLFVVCVAPTMLMGVSSGYLSHPTALMLSAAVGTAFALVSFGVPRDGGDEQTPVRDDATADVLRFGALSVGRGTLTWTICAVYSLATYGIMAATVGVHVRFLALDDIYDVRADYTADVGTGGALGYLLTGQAFVVNPLILARGIFRRRPSLIVLALVGQFLLYSSTGFKTVLFSFIAVLGMALVFRRRTGGASAIPFLAAPLAIMVASAAADEASGGITWTSVFTRRFMLTPGLLSSVYVDYFSQNPVAMYAYSFLGTWIDYPYDLAPPKRIADYLVPGSTGYANANLFADGFANFGWAGIGVAALVLWVWLRFVDHAIKGLPLRVAAMALVMPSIALSNTSIFTAMLSHGLVIGTVILLICPRTGWAPVDGAAGARRRRSTGDTSTRTRGEQRDVLAGQLPSRRAAELGARGRRVRSGAARPPVSGTAPRVASARVAAARAPRAARRAAAHAAVPTS